MDQETTYIPVVLFEDNALLRESIRRLVDASGTFVCTGAYPNLDKWEQHLLEAKPQIILMDIDMPGKSGIEGVKLIKYRYPDLCIIMQTVFEDNDKIFASLCAGASGYLLKPDVGERLIAYLQDIHRGGAAISPTIAARILHMFRGQNHSVTAEVIELSDREKEVLQLLVDGSSYKSIADKLFVSVDTVKSHLKKIYDKLHVHSKSEAVAKAIRQKLI